MWNLLCIFNLLKINLKVLSFLLMNAQNSVLLIHNTLADFKERLSVECSICGTAAGVIFVNKEKSCACILWADLNSLADRCPHDLMVPPGLIKCWQKEHAPDRGVPREGPAPGIASPFISFQRFQQHIKAGKRRYQSFCCSWNQLLSCLYNCTSGQTFSEPLRADWHLYKKILTASPVKSSDSSPLQRAFCKE